MDKLIVCCVAIVASLSLASCAIRPQNRWIYDRPGFGGRDGYYNYDTDRYGNFLRENRNYGGFVPVDDSDTYNTGYETHPNRYRNSLRSGLFGLGRNIGRNPPFYGGYR